FSSHTDARAGGTLPGAGCWRHWAPSKQQFRCLLGLHWPPRVEPITRPHPLVASHPGSPEEGPRVVFMVDLWHPNVAAAERQALDFIFAPGR
uniref:Uncharacterized protein n=1 Tax=Buteo japonicus TaxID=224669 RepID=A0A8C0HIC5_9AVES